MTFTAIDFETATAFHPCSVGIVTVKTVITDEFVSLIKTPKIVSIYNSSSWDISRVCECKIICKYS
jgi:hypothetical protein